MLDLGVGRADDAKGIGQSRVDIDAAAARRDAQDFLLGRRFRPRRAERDDRVDHRIDRREPEEVLAAEDVHGQHRALVREADLGRAAHRGGHRAGTIQDDVHGDGRRLLAVVVVGADGQHRFDGRAEVAAHAKTVFAADHDEPAAELLDPGAVKFHLVMGHLQGGHVAEREQVEALQFGQRARQPGRPADFHVDLRIAQRPGQRRGFLLVTRDEQDAGVSAQRNGGSGAVVLQPGVGGGQDFHLVIGKTVGHAQVREFDFVAPGPDRKLLLTREELVLVQVDLGGGGDVALDVGAQVERLAGFQAARDVDGGDEHLGRRRIAQRHGVDFDAVGGEAGGGRGPGVGGVVAVAQQHDSSRGPGWQDGGGKLQGAPDVGVGAGSIGGSGPLGGYLAALHRCLPDGGVLREAEHADGIVCATILDAVLDETARGGTGLGGNARGIINQINDRQIIAAPLPAHARQGQEDARQQERPHEQAGAALRRGQVGQ